MSTSVVLQPPYEAGHNGVPPPSLHRPMPDPNSAAPRVTSGLPNSHARLIDVLDALVSRIDSEPWGVRELASELEESRSTVNRILSALVERGLAVEVGSGKYGVGPRLGVLTAKLQRASPLFDWCSSQLSTVAETSGCTVMLSICCPTTKRYFVANYSSAKASLTFTPALGVQYPLTFGDIGRHFAPLVARLDSASAASTNIGDYRTPLLRGQLAESEYPRARAIVCTALGNGLLVSLSTHKIESEVEVLPDQEEEQLLALCNRLEEKVAVDPSVIRNAISIFSDPGSRQTTARLERLILLHCLFPQGIADFRHCHEMLLCNSVTAIRLIQSAVTTGLSTVVSGRAYPGPRLYQWAARLGGRRNSLADWVRPIINTVVERTGETIALLSYDEGARRAEFLEVVQGWRPIQYQLQTHVDVPLYAGASGKAVLAHCSPHEISRIQLQPFTETTITSHQALCEELATIRERGWATGDGERVPGAFGLATPFFIDGQVRGAISATVPRYRKEDLDLPKLASQMQEASRKISILLSV